MAADPRQQDYAQAKFTLLATDGRDELCVSHGENYSVNGLHYLHSDKADPCYFESRYTTNVIMPPVLVSTACLKTFHTLFDCIIAFQLPLQYGDDNSYCAAPGNKTPRAISRFAVVYMRNSLVRNATQRRLLVTDVS
jgi:hypothetical protein